MFKIKTALLIIVTGLYIFGCSSFQKNQPEIEENDFSFIFMTDIHLKPGKPVEAFKMAIDTANKLNSDFVITGGDLVFDVLRGNFERSDSLFKLYENTISEFEMPVYNCIGNHELFGIYEESDIDSTHPDYKYGMYERYFGNTYYSFDHKNWHFIVLNSLQEENKRYIGKFGSEQLDWIRKDLGKVSNSTPICIVLHIPLITVFDRYSTKHDDSNLLNKSIKDKDELLDIFSNYNLRLVLQGHHHWIEDLNVLNKTRFITGGSIAGRPSWRGIEYGNNGFMQIKIKGEEISWEYVDYGWNLN